MKKIKNGINKIFYLLLGIILAVSLILIGVYLIHANSKFTTISCITLSTTDGNYENASYGGKVTINGFSSGSTTTFQLQAGQNVNLNAFANDGYLFTGYYSNDNLLSTEDNFNFVLDKNQNQNIYAKFAKSVTLSLNVTNPFDETDVRQIEEICYVGQEVVVSELVAKSCDVTWAEYYQNSTPQITENLSNIVCDKNTITVGASSSNVTIAPSDSTVVGEYGDEYSITFQCSDGIDILVESVTGTDRYHNGTITTNEGFSAYSSDGTLYISHETLDGYVFSYWLFEYVNTYGKKVTLDLDNGGYVYPFETSIWGWKKDKNAVIRAYANKMCTITYMSNETEVYSTCNAVDTNTYEFPTEVPEKEGYTFEGWTSTPNSTNVEWRQGTKTCSGDKVWYPVWNKKNIVKYYYIDANGLWKTRQDTESTYTLYSAKGVPAADNGKTINIDSVSNKEFDYNGKHYTFIGFSDREDDYTVKYANNNDRIGLMNAETLYGKQLNLYAVYITKITLTFHADDVLDTPNPVTFAIGRCAGTNEINNQVIIYSLSTCTATLSNNIICDGWIYNEKYYSLNESIDIEWDCDVYAYWIVLNNILEGNGTKDNPYLIKNYDDYLCLALGVKSGMFAQKTQYFKQTENIDVSLYGIGIGEYDYKTQTQSSFKGVYDGNNNTIILNINNPDKDIVGVFGTNDGIIKNLGVVDSVIVGHSYVGGLVGYNKGTIENCYSTASVTGTGSYIGGLVGVNAGIINKCYNNGEVNGNKVWYGTSVGGIAGVSLRSGEISNSFNTGTITSNNSQWVGGITGDNHGEVKNIYNSGTVVGKVYVGGFSGLNSGDIINGYSIGKVSSSDVYTGSLVGCNKGTLNYAYFRKNTTYDGNGTVQYGVGTNELGSQGVNPQNVQGFLNAGTAANVDVVGLEGRSLDFALNFGAEYLAQLDGGDYCLWNIGTENYPTIIENQQSTNLKNEWNTVSYSDGGSIGWSGSGTRDDPYLIGSTDDIAWLALKVKGGFNYKNTYFQMNRNITYDSKTNAEFYPIGGYDTIKNYTYYFSGFFDGNNYSIINFAPTSEDDYVGLFGYNAGTISNVNMKNVSVTGNKYVGALCGYNTGTLLCCTVEGTIVGNSSYVGGIAGVNAGTINKCYNLGSVQGNSKIFGLAVGGIAGGSTSSSEILNSFNSGSVSSNIYQWIGGLVGQNHGNIRNSYNEGSVNGYAFVGGIAGQNSGHLSNLYNTGNVVSKYAYAGGLVGYDTSLNIEMCYYLTGCAKDGQNVNQKGIGFNIIGKSNNVEEDGIISFNNTAKLNVETYISGQKSNSLLLALNLGSQVLDVGEDKYLTWTNECYPTLLTSGTWNSTTIWSFEGAGDENSPFLIKTELDLYYFSIFVNSNYTFEGIYIQLANDIALSSEMSNILGTIGGYSESGLGTFAGIFDGNNHTISNINITSTSDYQGLFGYSTGTIKNLGIINSTITGGNYVGGICAYNVGQIENCYVTSSVKANGNYVGGICGYNQGSIINSYTNNVTTGCCSYIGGIAGVNNGIINKCYTLGNVTANSAIGFAVGGISGVSLANAEIYNCFNKSKISATNCQWVGGITGQNHGKVNNVFNKGNVLGSTYVGGLSGQNSGEINTGYNTGNVKSNIVYSGGVAGYNTGNIKNCFYLKNSAKDGKSFNQNGIGTSVSNEAVNDEKDYTICFDASQKVSKIKISGTYVTNLLDALYYAHLAIQQGAEKYCCWTEVNNAYPNICDDTTIPVVWNPYFKNILNTENTDIYLIYNLEDWNDFVANVNAGNDFNNKMIKLMANINLNGSANNITNVIGWYDSDLHEANVFAGTFDGNGYSITGIYINSTEKNVGLFAYNIGIIENLTIQGEIKGHTYVGGICGHNSGQILYCINKCNNVIGVGSYIGGLVGVNDGQINHCANLANVQGNAIFGFAVGGIVGENLSQGKIENSYSISSVTAKNYQWVGGVIGQNHGSVTNCGNSGSISGNTYVGGIVGQHCGELLNCYNYGTVKSSNVYCGGIAGCNNGNIDYSYYLLNCAKDGKNVSQKGIGAQNKGSTTNDVAYKTIQFTSDGKVNSITVAFSHNVETIQDALNAFVLNQREESNFYDSWSFRNNKYISFGFIDCVWDGISCAVYTKGSGTINDPYEIQNAKQLYNLSKESTKNKYYILTSDIYLNNCNFELDENLHINKWVAIEKFDGYLDGQNFAIHGLYINDTNLSNQGLIANNNGTIKNLAIVNSYVKAFDKVGSIAGTNNGRIKNCCNYATVSGNESVGGIVGVNNGLIDFCGNSANIYGINKNVGGIAGISYINIINSYNYGAIETEQTNVGGIVGQLYTSYITNCNNLGDISGKSCVGGIVGLNEIGDVKNTYSGGNVKGVNDYTGAVIGKNNDGSIEYSYYLKNSAVCGSTQKGIGSSTNQNEDKDGSTNIYNKDLTTSSIVVCGQQSYSLKDNLEIWIENNSTNDIPYNHWKVENEQVVLTAYWEGAHDGSYSGGKGTSADPYKISTANDLAYLAYQVNHGNKYENTYFIMTNNIYINDETFVFDVDTGLVKVTDGYNTAYLGTGILGQNTGFNTAFDKTASVSGKWYSDKGNVGGTYYGEIYQWTPIGQVNTFNYFAGDFDGYEYYISGLYINGTSINQGLFGKITGTVKNVGLVNSYICGKQNIGGIVATNDGTILNAYNDSIVLSQDKTAGGIVGTLENSAYIYNVYSTGAVYGKSYTGGIVGIVNGGTVNNAYNWGYVFNGNNVGTVCGNVSSSSKLKNIYGWSSSTASGNSSTIISKNQIASAQSTLNNLATKNCWSLWFIDTATGKPSFDGYLWNGKKANEYAGGNGTKDSPYLIATPEQLLYFSTGGNRGQYAKIIKDLYLNDETVEFMQDTGLIKVTDGINVAYVGTGVKGNSVGNNTFFDETPSTKGVWYIDELGTEGAYTGTLNIWNGIKDLSTNLDGDNHRIYGLYSTTSGLIDTLTEGVIKNVKINNGLIIGENVAGIANVSYGGDIENCSFDGIIVGENVAGIVQQTTFDEEKIKLETYYADSGEGSLTFYSGIKHTNVTKSTNYATLIGDNVGGIIQDAQYLEYVEYCTNIGQIYATQSAGGIIQKYYGNNKECLVGGRLDTNGGTLTGNATGLDNKIESYGIKGTNDQDIYNVKFYFTNNVNYGNISCEGTASGVINNIESENSIITNITYTYNKYARLGSEQSQTLHTFYGTKSFTYYAPSIEIKGCENYGDITGGDYTCGVFGRIKQNSIRSLNVSGTFVNYGDITGKDYVAGVFLEQNYALIGAENYGNITGKDFVGGITAYQNAKIESSSNYGNIKGEEYVGGIVGYQKSTITSVISTGNIQGKNFVGGISGFQNGTTTNAKFDGNLTAETYAGGIAGYAKGKIENANSQGNIDATSIYVAGIVGSIDGNVLTSWSNMTISGESYVGGIAGYCNGLINQCYSAGEIVALVSQAGGIAGEANSFVTDCWTVAKVYGQYYVGGVVGYAESCVFNNCKYALLFAQASSSYPSGQGGIGVDIEATPNLSEIEGISYFDEDVLIALEGSIDVTDIQTFFDLAELENQSGYLSAIEKQDKYYIFNGKQILINNCGLTLDGESAVLFAYRFAITITLDTNGFGTIPSYYSSEGWEISEDNTTAVKEINVNGNMGNLPTPVAVGYKFDGWYKDSILFNEKVGFGYKYDSSFTTLYAKWSVSSAIITIDTTNIDCDIPETEGWIITSDKQVATKCVYLNRAIGTLPEISKDGYVFDGWYLNAEFSEHITSSTIYTWSTNITLYPKLIKNELTITIRLDDVEWKNSGITLELYSEKDLKNAIWKASNIVNSSFSINNESLILSDGNYKIKATIWVKANGDFAGKNFGSVDLTVNVHGKSTSIIDYYSITLMKDSLGELETGITSIDSVYIKSINKVILLENDASTIEDIHNNTQIVLKGTKITIGAVINTGDGYKSVSWIDENGNKVNVKGNEYQISSVDKAYYLTAKASK